MCGLAVAFNRLGSSVINIPGVHAMNKSMFLRGPDDGNLITTSHSVLAHRRLSIVDVKNGSQPMVNNNGDIHIVFNGEIYNHNELRSYLIGKGQRFFTKSDTEVILVGYEYFGESIFEKLDGMFSIVISDQRKGVLVVARDRYGIKPLYKKQTKNGTILLASELSAIRAYDRQASEALDGKALDNYLTLGYMIENRTIINDIVQVDRGSYEIYRVDNDIVKRTLFWSALEPINNGDVNDVPSVEEGLSLIKSAVISQSGADKNVNIGCFLSGGLDSSIIASILSDDQKGKGKHLHTYTASFDEHGYDESDLAKNFSNIIGSQHKTVTFSQKLIDDAPLLNDIYSGPFSDNAALPTFYLSKTAKQDVKVLLSGDGADELFFGYRNHTSMLFESKLREIMPTIFSEKVLPWLSSVYPNHAKIPRVLRAGSTLKSLSMSLGEAYCNAMSVTDRSQLDRLYTDEFKSSLQGYKTQTQFSNIAMSCGSEDPLKIIQYLDFETYLPGSVLTKSDRATMSASLEARLPFLNNDLVDRILPLASKHNIDVLNNKKLLRKWSKPIIPNNIVNRKKRSFTSPLDKWFRSLPLDTIRGMIMPCSMMDRNIFKVSELNKLVDQHFRDEANHGATLWSILVLTHSLGSDADIIYNKDRYAHTLSPQNRF